MNKYIIGKTELYNKEDHNAFRIIDIPDDVLCQLDLYLSVIIRDYLRAFIQNTPAIGNCVIEDESPLYKATEKDWKKWESLVNSVTDEFDELVKIIKQIDSDTGSDLMSKKSKLQKKAFENLAYIYDDLCW